MLNVMGSYARSCYRVSTLLSVFVLGMFLTGCNYQVNRTLTQDTKRATYAALAVNLFANHCTACHARKLGSYDAVMKLVRAGEPAEKSDVFDIIKIGRMPPPNNDKHIAPVSQELLDDLRTWIESGAKND